MITVLVACGALVLGLLGGLWLSRLGAGKFAPRGHNSAAAAVEAQGQLAGVDVEALADRLAHSQHKFDDQLSGVESLLQAQVETFESSQAHARVDPLTHLPDRQAFEEDLCRRLAEWRRKQTALAVMRLDIDYFHRFHAVHGSEAGDAVLRGVALVLRGSLREMDVIARLGRDEFAVILPSTTAHEAAVAGKRVRAEIAAATFQHGDLPLKATVSVGLAEADVGDHAALLLEHADAALHAAKRGGRNAVQIYTRRGMKPIPAFEPQRLLPTDSPDDPAVN